MADPFNSFNPNVGLTPNLVPNPPGEIPSPWEAGNAAPKSPFVEALDVDKIIANLVLDRPLKLFMPNRHLYPDFEFRIINSIPQEIAAAKNKGFQQVTDPELASLFNNLVAGTDKQGKAFQPLLFARPKAVGEHVRKRHRKELAAIYAGMDPSNKEFPSRYAENAGTHGGTKGQFTGDGWRIRV
jgi:hypothetical protein